MGAVATCAAAAGGLVVVGTSSGTCTVHDFADGTPRDVDCASLVHSGRGSSSPSSVAGIGSDALGRLTSAFGASVSSSSSAPQTPPRAVAVSAVCPLSLRAPTPRRHLVALPAPRCVIGAAHARSRPRAFRFVEDFGHCRAPVAERVCDV